MTDRGGSDGDLSARIAAAKVADARGASASQRAEGRGWAIGIEFIGTVLVCAAIGWGIDHYLLPQIKPFGMIVLLVLGFVAAVRRAARTSAQFDNSPANDARP